MSEDVDIAETFNSFFCEAVRSLDIKGNTYILSDTAGITDPIDVALLKYELHPSVLKIKEIYLFICSLFKIGFLQSHIYKYIK